MMEIINTGNKLKGYCRLGDIEKSLHISSSVSENQLKEALSICVRNGHHRLINALFVKHRELKNYIHIQHITNSIEHEHLETLLLLIDHSNYKISFVQEAINLSIEKDSVKFLTNICNYNPTTIIPIVRRIAFPLFKMACANYKQNCAKYLYTKFPELYLFVSDEDNYELFSRIIKLALYHEQNNEIIATTEQPLFTEWLFSLNIHFRVLVSIVPHFISEPMEYRTVTENTGCVICYGDASIITECNHLYCETCIRQLQERYNNCAYCRKQYKSVSYITLEKIDNGV